MWTPCGYTYICWHGSLLSAADRHYQRRATATSSPPLVQEAPEKVEVDEEQQTQSTNQPPATNTEAASQQCSDEGLLVVTAIIINANNKTQSQSNRQHLVTVRLVNSSHSSLSAESNACVPLPQCYHLLCPRQKPKVSVSAEWNKGKNWTRKVTLIKMRDRCDCKELHRNSRREIKCLLRRRRHIQEIRAKNNIYEKWNALVAYFPI